MLFVSSAEMLFLAFVAVLACSATSSGAQDSCTQCDCIKQSSVIYFNCTERNLEHIIPWPSFNGTIIAMYAGNEMATLEPLPDTNVTVIIDLSHSKIRYLKPGLFVHTRNIKFVDLSYNLLPAEEISADRFKGPYNETSYEPLALEHLDLAYNQIHSLPKKLFEHMPNLKILNLEGNNFKVLDVHTQLALNSLMNLESLNLADNELTELVGGAIETLQNLNEINLARNCLDFVPSTLTRVGRSLKKLNISDNPIMEFVADTFLGLENIVELSANNLTKLNYVNVGTFASMPKLKVLRLSYNWKLHDIDREAFGVNQSITEFELNNNDLFRIDHKLLPWSRLRVFKFDHNPLECSCDLYNITSELPEEITRQEDGPFCTDPRTDRYVQVFHLKKDICSFKSKTQTQREFIEHHFSVVRITLIVLSAIVMLVALAAAVLGVIRYKKYQRSLNYPYASQILYNPVATTTTSKY